MNPATQVTACQEHQREGHAQRTFMRSVLGMQFSCFLSPEDAVVQAEHVEGGHSGNDGHNPTHRCTVLETGRQDFIFGEESGEGRNAGNGQTGYQEGDVRDGHVFAQTSHGATSRCSELHG